MLAHQSVQFAWSLDPLVCALAFAALACFLQGFVRLRRRRASLAPWSRLVLFGAGVAVVLVGLVSPLDAIAEEYLQSAHMLQHVLIADLGVALALVAVRGPLAVFFLPPALLVPLARSRTLRRGLSAVLRPRVVLPCWLLAVIVWHVPALYEAALARPTVHVLEHLSFVLAGSLVWTLIVDPARHLRLSLHGRIAVTALLFWTSQVLAYVTALASAPLYGRYAEQPERLLGFSPLGDQRVAAVLMMVEQTLTVGVAFVLLVRASRARSRTQAGAAVPA
ncbi:MAG: cytochrome c oxidase assembly protein [Thermoleophilia bacterium]|nr:cytochrome c oxidase assembly protein [Thermoleophilia bacterium]